LLGLFQHLIGRTERNQLSFDNCGCRFARESNPSSLECSAVELTE